MYNCSSRVMRKLNHLFDIATEHLWGKKKNPVKDVCVVLYVPSCIMFIQLFYFIRITQDRNAYGINSSPKNDTSKCHNLLKQCSMPLFDHEFNS